MILRRSRQDLIDRFSRGCGIAFFGLMLVACATVPDPGSADAPLFYPPLPQEPRIQFLGSYSTSTDVVGEISRFRKFIVGQPEELPLVKPYGFSFWQDSVYICDTVLAALVVMDFEKDEMRYVRPIGAGRLAKPVNISIGLDGRKFIADTGRGAVIVLDEKDAFIGVLKRDDGFKPVDVVVAGHLAYVADLHHREIGVWDAQDYSYLYSIPSTDEFRLQGKLFSPTNIALDDDGNVYVSDIGATHVVKYGSDGTYLATFGSQGLGPGQFVRPKGIDVDSDGRLYVADAATEVVQIFDHEGTLLLYFGDQQGGDPLLNLPAKIQINTSLLDHFQPLASPSFSVEYLIFVSSQYGGHKISVFGFGS